MTEMIICSECKKPISSEETKVTQMKDAKLLVYHSRCFALKSTRQDQEDK